MKKSEKFKPALEQKTVNEVLPANFREVAEIDVKSEGEQSDSEKEKVPEHELAQLRAGLENQEMLMTEVAKIGEDLIVQAFADYKDSDKPAQRSIWNKVKKFIEMIEEKKYTSTSLWSIFDKDSVLILNKVEQDNLDKKPNVGIEVRDSEGSLKEFILPINNLNKNVSALVGDVNSDQINLLKNEMKNRGFEALDEIKINNVSIDKIRKKRVPIKEIDSVSGIKLFTHEDEEYEFNESFIIEGRINLDTIIFTDQDTEFTWIGNNHIYNKESRDVDSAPQIYAGKAMFRVDFEESIDIILEKLKKFAKENNYSEKETKRLLKAQENLLTVQGKYPDFWFSSKKSEEIAKKFGLDRLDLKYFKKGPPASLDEELRYIITRNVVRVLDKYFECYVKIKDSTSLETLKSKYLINSEISSQSEAEIDEMFKQGLETGEFDSMLLYIGDGAQKFLDITASEDYKVMNKEFLLMREHMEELANDLKDSSVYELGPGNGKKTKELLEEIKKARQAQGIKSNVSYHPIDINPMMIYATAEEMAYFDGVDIEGFVCDFHDIADKVDKNEKNSFLLLGNTLGNGDEKYQVELLEDIKKAMKPGEKLIAGVQMKTDWGKVVAGYQGLELGVLMKQMLKRFNISEEDTDYHAEVDEKNNQIIMALTFNKDIKVSYQGIEKEFKPGDKLTTAVSHKYDTTDIANICTQSGFQKVEEIFNKNKDYVLIKMEA